NNRQALYLDGAQVAIGIASVSIGYDTNWVELGHYGSGYFAGRIDEATIYNRALSLSEIAAIYNAGSAGKSSEGPYLNNPPVLPVAIVGQVYTQVFTAVRGQAPIGFTLIGGAVPPGLVLSSTGVFSGTPVAAGNYNFTVRATDGADLFVEQPLGLQVFAQVPPPAGIVGWWRAEKNALDSICH